MTNRCNRRSASELRKLFAAGAMGAARVTRASAFGVLRWACTDHLGTVRALGSLALLGLGGTVEVILIYVYYVTVYAIAMGIAVWFTVAVWIPFLFGVLFFS